ncbi:shikimate kinase [Parasphingopyxis marina]|uniref:Shikimate kinase n=1 Tax=Parasphingopyxis marina TaxID=2761622 RepID=A0A842I0J3_9SPHN|nr:shikimate kinase [Parasphingopyxis marina]MBC2778203.1 shikimate kinase [Parasphingopyxis marina]
MTHSPSEHSPAPAATRSHIDKPVVLVGLMGVGKSTIGRRLATRLGLPFIDSDDEIEKASGMTVGELFENYGEDYFRDGERRVIARLIDGAVKVIATGGGAFVQQETRELILKEAIAVWLDADIAVLTERVSRRNTRPLLRDTDPHMVLSELAEKRRPFYEQAQIHVRSNDGAHEETVERILEALAK